MLSFNWGSRPVPKWDLATHPQSLTLKSQTRSREQKTVQRGHTGGATVLVTRLLLWRDILTKVTVKRKHLIGGWGLAYSFRGESLNIMAVNFVASRQTWCWSSSWELTSYPYPRGRKSKARLGLPCAFETPQLTISGILLPTWMIFLKLPITSPIRDSV